MKIILLKDVRKVGKRWELKDVADGFALNSLIPAGQAVPATANNLKMIEAKKAQSLLEKKVFEEAFEKALAKLVDRKLVIAGKTNEKGHLFAGIHKEQIISELKNQTGFELPLDYLELEKPIKEIGESRLKVSVGDLTRVLIIEIRAL